jgi:ubiquinone/menaquinone biosynthesis C-methylase UbiE
MHPMRTDSLSRSPRLYTDFASWWPLLSPPSHYVEEAADIVPTLMSAPDAAPRTMLELGCGGGSLAFHLKRHFQLTLTDRSEPMLAVCRQVNPECEHHLGDMRTVDLDRQFDLVMIHDAIMYLTDETSLRAALANAYRHCRPGGAVVLIPDCVTETFAPTTDHGGEDGDDGRALRYLEWEWDPDPNDTVSDVVYSLLFRHADGTVTAELDHHMFGLFPRQSWIEWLRAEGFNEATSRIDPWKRDIFVAKKRGRV